MMTVRNLLLLGIITNVLFSVTNAAFDTDVAWYDYEWYSRSVPPGMMYDDHFTYRRYGDSVKKIDMWGSTGGLMHISHFICVKITFFGTDEVIVLGKDKCNNPGDRHKAFTFERGEYLKGEFTLGYHVNHFSYIKFDTNVKDFEFGNPGNFALPVTRYHFDVEGKFLTGVNGAHNSEKGVPQFGIYMTHQMIQPSRLIDAEYPDLPDGENLCNPQNVHNPLTIENPSSSPLNVPVSFKVAKGHYRCWKPVTSLAYPDVKVTGAYAYPVLQESGSTDDDQSTWVWKEDDGLQMEMCNEKPEEEPVSMTLTLLPNSACTWAVTQCEPARLEVEYVAKMKLRYKITDGLLVPPDIAGTPEDHTIPDLHGVYEGISYFEPELHHTCSRGGIVYSGEEKKTDDYKQYGMAGGGAVVLGLVGFLMVKKRGAWRRLKEEGKNPVKTKKTKKTAKKKKKGMGEKAHSRWSVQNV